MGQSKYRSSGINQISDAPDIPIPTNKDFRNLTKCIFGRLTVIKFAGRVNHRTYWWCTCQCNPAVALFIEAQCLLSNNTTSCGCYKIEQTGKCRKKHGLTVEQILSPVNSKVKFTNE